MQTEQRNGGFIKNSSIMIAEIKALCDHLSQMVEKNPNVSGHLIKTNAVLNRLEEYLKFFKIDDLDISTLETINVVDEVASDLKNANANHRRGDRMSLRYNCPEEEERQNFAIPFCLPIMKQALYQIVDNAVKYSTQGSELEITMNYDSESDRRTITFTNLGPKVYDEELDDIENDIFCKSVRGRNAENLKPKSGLGLGLNFVDMIVSCHKWINARVYADSGDIKMQYNNIDYADFSITIEFCDTCSSIDDVDTYLYDLQRVMEIMLKHELAGSMPELTRLAYQTAIQCINTKSIDDGTKRLAYNLFDNIVEFIFYLESQSVSSRPMNFDNYADIILARFVTWAYVYRKNGDLSQKKFGEEPKNHHRFTPPIFTSFVVVAQWLAKFVVDTMDEFKMTSDKMYFEFCSENKFENPILPDHLRKLLQECGLNLIIRGKSIILQKI